MDYTAIVTAALSAVVTLVVCLVNNHFQVSKTTALISYRLEELEKKVDKHNNVVDRTYKLEQDITRLQDEVNRHKERLREAEGKMNKMEDTLK